MTPLRQHSTMTNTQELAGLDGGKMGPLMHAKHTEYPKNWEQKAANLEKADSDLEWSIKNVKEQIQTILTTQKSFQELLRKEDCDHLRKPEFLGCPLISRFCEWWKG